MFDVGMMEIMIILVIALLVIGPERMPEVARKIGAFMGKTKRFVNSMKENNEFSNVVNDIKSSINVDDLQETLSLKEIQKTMNLDEEKKSLEKIHDDLTNKTSNTAKDFDLDSLESPFSSKTSSSKTSSSKTSQTNSNNQFNKAPSQPEIPSEVEPQPTYSSSVSSEESSKKETLNSTDSAIEQASIDEAPEPIATTPPSQVKSIPKATS